MMRRGRGGGRRERRGGPRLRRMSETKRSEREEELDTQEAGIYVAFPIKGSHENQWWITGARETRGERGTRRWEGGGGRVRGGRRKEEGGGEEGRRGREKK